MKNKIIKIVIPVILIILILVVVYKLKESNTGNEEINIVIPSKEKILKMLAEEISYSEVKQKIYIPKEEIKYKNEYDVDNLINALEKKFKNFDKNDYEVRIGIAEINDEVVPCIRFKYKIGEFYTNSAYEIMIEDEKVSQIIYNPEATIMSKKTIEKLKKYSLVDAQVLKYFKEITSVLEEKMPMYVKIEKVKLFYDVKEKKKYIDIAIGTGNGEVSAVIERRFEIIEK